MERSGTADLPTPSAPARFQAFVVRKTQEAACALLRPLVTLDDRSHLGNLQPVGNAWTRSLDDGDFHLPETPRDRPGISLVFVQSREGNTGVSNPEELGGGATDKHLIYEGLSRVGADAVLAGAATATGDVFFSVWHPQLVALRSDLGLPRHPAQIVVSGDGRVDFDALLFNAPGVPVFLIAGDKCWARSAAVVASRPWIQIVRLTGTLRDAVAHLRAAHGITRISAVGGRSTATALIDEGLVHDLCLTTTPSRAGERDTPFYTGTRRPTLDVIVTKRDRQDPKALTFEHSALRRSR